MSDIIRLLPDNIANQIAAGEVIQRPSSVVKELVENAVDAGSTSIKLILVDSGRTLVQVIDDGVGMSENDARMCFERHATSKIKTSDDLFKIMTKGFRGEALASIAAVAQVELKTKQAYLTTGVSVKIENSKIIEQSSIATADGTSIAVKNLFYNVPARRNFLKSDATEMSHNIDEFVRIAMAHPAIKFELIHNGNQIYFLPVSGLKQRVVNIFGKKSNEQLVAISETTEILQLEGFSSKPDAAKKKRGDQYFFVNGRFIKSTYLHHAVMSAYEGLLPKDEVPMYAIFLTIDPIHVDINVHPTKQEIKFDDERMVYNYLKTTVKHALGSHHVSPSLDFELSVGFLNHQKERPMDIPAKGNSLFSFPKATPRDKNNISNWQALYQDKTSRETRIESSTEDTLIENTIILKSQIGEVASSKNELSSFATIDYRPYQLHDTYIIATIKSGMMLIHQQFASERIVYERALNALSGQKESSQRLLFPITVHLSRQESEEMLSILDQVNNLGFDIQEFGNDSFV